jgi:hypothetical protein
MCRPNGSADKGQERENLSIQEPARDEGENAQVAVEISDDDEGEGVEAETIGPNRRKLTSTIWMQFKREKMEGQVYSLFEKAWRRNQKWE